MMVSDTSNSQEVINHPVLAEQYRFISFQVPSDANDQTQRRLARSHAVRQALESQRKVQRESGDNFRVTVSKAKPRKWVRSRTHTECRSASPFSLSASAFDPFQTLAVDSTRLQTLLNNSEARKAPEPVFSIAEELAFQSFRLVFRIGLVDPALLNAVMLSLVFAVKGGRINDEGLGYQNQAIGHIRERMNSINDATSESTIGAILLLAGVEARLGMKSHVQLHIGAVNLLLRVCQAKGVHLTGGIKRAIFWQDLNSSILIRSNRIVNHTTFAELQWTRDLFSPNFFRLPPGFQKQSHLMTHEFVEVLEDLNALQCIRDVPGSTKGDVMFMARINNHIASIQSRIVDLPKHSPVLDCCRLAAYICSVMLCCTVWCALAIPSHISSQLLGQLRQTNNDPLWDEYPDLIVWMLYIGGAFTPSETTRLEYITLLRSHRAIRAQNMYRSWPAMLGVLKQFIWSDKAFMPHMKALWEETLT